MKNADIAGVLQDDGTDGLEAEGIRLAQLAHEIAVADLTLAQVVLKDLTVLHEHQRRIVHHVLQGRNTVAQPADEALDHEECGNGRDIRPECPARIRHHRRGQNRPLRDGDREVESRHLGKAPESVHAGKGDDRRDGDGRPQQRVYDVHDSPPILPVNQGLSCRFPLTFPAAGR